MHFKGFQRSCDFLKSLGAAEKGLATNLGQVWAAAGSENAKMKVKACYKVLNKITRHILEGNICVHDFIEGFGGQGAVV